MKQKWETFIFQSSSSEQLINWFKNINDHLQQSRVPHLIIQSKQETEKPSQKSPKFIEFRELKSYGDHEKKYYDVVLMGDQSLIALVLTAR